MSKARQVSKIVNATTVSGTVSTFVSSPIVPTATANNQAVNKGQVDTIVAGVVNSAPSTLDTLNELASALGNDANFSTTVTNSIATKAPKDSPTFTGTVSGVTKAHVGLGNVTNESKATMFASPTFTGTVIAPTFSGALTGNASTATNASAATFTTQPNASWGAKVQLGGNGGGSGVATIATVQTTDGNLHLDPGLGKQTYINHYSNGTIYLNGTTYSISANGSSYNGNSATASTLQTARTINGVSFNGSSNITIPAGATGAGSDKIFFENGQTITTSYSITAGMNAMTTGNITINNGVTVTVPTGARWVIV